MMYNDPSGHAICKDIDCEEMIYRYDPGENIDHVTPPTNISVPPGPRTISTPKLTLTFKFIIGTLPDLIDESMHPEDWYGALMPPGLSFPAANVDSVSALIALASDITNMIEMQLAAEEWSYLEPNVIGDLYYTIEGEEPNMEFVLHYLYVQNMSSTNVAIEALVLNSATQTISIPLGEELASNSQIFYLPPMLKAGERMSLPIDWSFSLLPIDRDFADIALFITSINRWMMQHQDTIPLHGIFSQ
jgi:hypothetical protein